MSRYFVIYICLCLILNMSYADYIIQSYVLFTAIPACVLCYFIIVSVYYLYKCLVISLFLCLCLM